MSSDSRQPSLPIVISASRRTDIPAFYMPWFMRQIEKRRFEITNPFNRKTAVVSAPPGRVHTILFWSKNFGPFIEGGYGHALRGMGYHLFFNFTINSTDSCLEPHVPPLEERLKQLEYICGNFDARSVNWRFDPICFYQSSRGVLNDNLGDFEMIAQKACQYGIRRCITSFRDDYAKIRKRILRIPGFAFIDPPIKRKMEIILKMKTALAAKGITLSTCCEKALLERLPAGSGVRPSSCIPNDLLMALFEGQVSMRQDSGQRVKAGCGCKISMDIGSYHLHPCYHNCLFCYANPKNPAKPNSKIQNQRTNA